MGMEEAKDTSGQGDLVQRLGQGQDQPSEGFIAGK